MLIKKLKPAGQKIKMPAKFSDEPKGLVIFYLGAGKGKTTAAMGMAIRAAGAGMNVYILQFVKAKAASKDKIKDGEWPVSSEIDFLNFAEKKLGSSWGSSFDLSRPAGTLPTPGEGGIGKIYNEQLGLGFVGILGDKKEKEVHIKAALDGLSRAREIITSGKYQVIILDEIISALESKLIEERDIIDLIDIKAPLQHLVLTGHNKYPKIMEKCDLITEMTMIKHPYYKGILAQRGIDY
jgi:cob(I)alamin adenosyltransferase